MRWRNRCRPVLRRRSALAMILVIAGLVTAVRPAGPARADRASASITVAYMALNPECRSYFEGGGGIPGSVSTFTPGVDAVCVFIQGTFTAADTIAATVVDSANNTIYTGTSGGALGASGPNAFGFTDVQYRTGNWPDGTYRTAISIGGSVVQTLTWAVGTGVAAPSPTSTGAAVPPSNTPITPPSATPVVPPSSTPRAPTTATPTTVPPSRTPRAVAATSTPTPTAAPPNAACTGSVTNVVRCTRHSVLLVAGELKGGDLAIGTGFVVRADASGTYLVTNLHVLLNTLKGKVVVGDPFTNHLYPAQVVALNKARAGSAGDLAVIRIQPTRLTPLHWGDSEVLQEGDTVISIGYPLRDRFSLQDTPTITDGIISALHRDEGDGFGRVWIQHQSIINHGNSGGPLLDLQGRIVGVNTLGVDQLPSPTGKGLVPVQGIFYAIPSNLAHRTSDALIRTIISGKVPVPVAPTPVPVRPSTTMLYKGKGFQISLPGDWTVKHLNDGTAVFLNGDGSIDVAATTFSIKGQVSDAGAKKVIASIAADYAKSLNGRPSITYAPVSIGSLTGEEGTVTVAGTRETLTIYVVGTSGAALVVDLDALPGATHQDVDQAIKTIQTIRLS